MYKSKLQELCQRHSVALPEYTSAKDGPDHDARFTATVTVNGVSFQSPLNQCRSAKDAQNLASRYAFEYFCANSPALYSPQPSATPLPDPPLAPGAPVVAAASEPLLQSLSSPSQPSPAPVPVPVSLVADFAFLPPQFGQIPRETFCSAVGGPQPVLPPLLQQTPPSPAQNLTEPSTPNTKEDQSKESNAQTSVVTPLHSTESANLKGMYKSKLVELCHKLSWNQPEYTTVKEGPDHNPRFGATVIVNGISFKTPDNQCRSSKEATNLAACIALDHLTGSKLTVPQQFQFPSTASSSSGMHYMYKNQLQQYAQKRGITLPEYSCETEGPPHARRFRSKVAFGGKIFESQEFFLTLKEAEQAAAKIALEGLSPYEVQKGAGLYKTLLQQLEQKRGGLFPVYKTIQSGPPHDPTFLATVEVGDETYQGQEAKSKKQAEMSAAEVAYNSRMKDTCIASKRQKLSTAPVTHVHTQSSPSNISSAPKSHSLTPLQHTSDPGFG